jgi:hypothetical protein
MFLLLFGSELAQRQALKIILDFAVPEIVWMSHGKSGRVCCLQGCCVKKSIASPGKGYGQPLKVLTSQDSRVINPVLNLPVQKSRHYAL